MTWTCDQIEARLSDYLDGLLAGAESAEFEKHAEECAQCGPLLASVKSLVSEMHAMEEVEAPPRLVYTILDQTLGPRETATGWKGFLNFIRELASPKFAYGAASVMATLVILLGASGFSWRKPKLADLSPTNVYRKADQKIHRGKAQVVKYVSDLRVVYEIQSRLRQDQGDLQAQPEETRPKSAPEKDPGQTDDHTHAQPRQQNRANEMARQMEMLAAECPMILERSYR
jgi:Putative zinc-finger